MNIGIGQCGPETNQILNSTKSTLTPTYFSTSDFLQIFKQKFLINTPKTLTYNRFTMFFYKKKNLPLYHPHDDTAEYTKRSSEHHHLQTSSYK